MPLIKLATRNLQHTHALPSRTYMSVYGDKGWNWILSFKSNTHLRTYAPFMTPDIAFNMFPWHCVGPLSILHEYWLSHDDVMKWKKFSVTGLFCMEFIDHREFPAGDLRRHRGNYDVTLMVVRHMLRVYLYQLNRHFEEVMINWALHSRNKHLAVLCVIETAFWFQASQRHATYSHYKRWR